MRNFQCGLLALNSVLFFISIVLGNPIIAAINLLGCVCSIYTLATLED